MDNDRIQMTVKSHGPLQPAGGIGQLIIAAIMLFAPLKIGAIKIVKSDIV